MSTKIVGIDPLQAPLGEQFRCLACQVDSLKVYIYADRQAMGQAAASGLVERKRQIVEQQGFVNCLYAAAPSQNDLLHYLVEDDRAPWEQEQFAGQMDEYLGLPASDPRSFRYYHNTHLWGPLLSQGRPLDPQVIHQLQGEAPDPVAEAQRYAQLLREHPPDVVQGGLGEENAHLAFNDPPEASFDDPQLVKIVEVAPEAKQQQVNEGHYRDVSEIPDALTLTIPALARFTLDDGTEHTVSYWSCVAPTRAKATAVEKMLLGEITEKVPATILRTLPEAALFLDVDAACLLHERGAVDLGPFG